MPTIQYYTHIICIILLSQTQLVLPWFGSTLVQLQSQPSNKWHGPQANTKLGFEGGLPSSNIDNMYAIDQY